MPLYPPHPMAPSAPDIVSVSVIVGGGGLVVVVPLICFLGVGVSVEVGVFIGVMGLDVGVDIGLVVVGAVCPP